MSYFVHQHPAYHHLLHSFPTRRSSDLCTQSITGWARRPVRSATCVAQRCWVMSNGDVKQSQRPLTGAGMRCAQGQLTDRKSTRLHSSHLVISYAVFCLKKKNRTGGVS